MNSFISVIIPSYNPDYARFDKTISGLRAQNLSQEHWELIIVDNNSTPKIEIDIGWMPNHKIIREGQQGLSRARLKGFEQACGDIIVMVDDDNILNKDYLEEVLCIFESDEKLGAIGGKSLPLFEVEPPVWLLEFYGNLALRDLGNSAITTYWQNEYPSSAPIGAGMALRKAALNSYISRAVSSSGIIADRTGNSLSSGGDNDIIIEVLKSGWRVGYFPRLILKHIIPEERMQVSYLARLANNINFSWIQVLDHHGINPWSPIPQWTLPLRKIKAWFIYRAWLNKKNYIKWQGICGLYEGLAQI